MAPLLAGPGGRIYFIRLPGPSFSGRTRGLAIDPRLSHPAVMALEIERRFLVCPRKLRLRGGTAIRQAYFPVRGGTGRVRIAGRRAYLTFKGPPRGIARREIEQPISVGLARELMAHLCTPAAVVKRRHRRRHGTHVWEIDVFEGKNRGLVLAEVELRRADEAVDLPPWISTEVSTDRRFTNSSLAKRPFRTWTQTWRAAVRRAMQTTPS